MDIKEILKHQAQLQKFGYDGKESRGNDGRGLGGILQISPHCRTVP